MLLRRFFVFLFLLILCAPSFSLGGAFTGEKNLRVIETEWFDIIYSESSEKSAKKIAIVADSYYDEITKRLSTDKYQRFPVAVTGAVESCNAFFSLAPYNLIVVYDTFATESLDMHENTVEAIFYHELTHAVTLNMKSPFFRGLSTVFADFLTPAGISLTSFWFEGAAVSLEGGFGDGGRIRDPFASGLVSVAKIREALGERKFPSWRDVTGARDTTPGGTDAYTFGSSFAFFLQERYGMEKYAEFWRNAGTSTSLSFCAGVFRKTYGISMDLAWRDFRDSVPLLDFFDAEFSLLSRKKSVVTAFDSFVSGDSVRTAWFDSQSTGVFLEENGKVRRLLSITGVRRLSFSPDGRFLAVDRYISRSNVKCECGIIEVESGRYKCIEKSDSVNSFLDFGGKLNFDRISVLKNSDEFFYSPLQISETVSAKIVKSGLDWKIRIESGGGRAEIDFGKRIVHNLRLSKIGGRTILSFAWADLGKSYETLPRLGFIELGEDLGTAKIFLQKSNLRFGVEGCQIFSADGENAGFFVCAENFDSRPLVSLSVPVSEFSAETVELKFSSISNVAFQENPENGEGAEFCTKKYSPLKFYARGALIPVGTAAARNFDLESVDTAFLGATFVTTNPWLDRRLSLSAGYNPFFSGGAFGCAGSFSGGNDSFSYSFALDAFFGSGGFLQGFAGGELAKVLARFNASRVFASASSSYFDGGENSGVSEGETWRKGRRSVSSLSLGFSSIRKFRPGFSQYFGISFAPFLLNEYFDYSKMNWKDVEVSQREGKYLNAGATTSIRFPGIFPISASASLFPNSDTFVSASARAVLFDIEIQKGIRAVSIFLNRFYLTLGYSAKIEYSGDEFFDIRRTRKIARDVEKDDFSDAISVSAIFDWALNTSYLAAAAPLSTGVSLAYRPHPQKGKKDWAFNLVMSLNL